MLAKLDRIQILSNSKKKSFDIKYASQLIHLVYSTKEK